MDAVGNLFIADGENHRVRKVDPSGIITTFAGEGSQGPLRDCCRSPFGLALDAAGNRYVSDRPAQLRAKLTALNYPGGMAFDQCGNLLIADLGNDRVRRLNLSPPCRSSAAVGSGSEAAGPGREIALVIIGVVVGAGGALVYRRIRRMAA